MSILFELFIHCSAQQPRSTGNEDSHVNARKIAVDFQFIWRDYTLFFKMVCRSKIEVVCVFAFPPFVISKMLLAWCGFKSKSLLIQPLAKRFYTATVEASKAANVALPKIQ